MKRKFVATFTGHEAVMSKPVKIQEMVLTSFQIALAFPNLSYSMNTEHILFNFMPLMGLGESIITTNSDLASKLQTVLLNGGALPGTTVTFDSTIRKLILNLIGPDTLSFEGNSGLVFGFDKGVSYTGTTQAPYPINLIPFKSLAVTFTGLSADDDFQTVTGESFDLIIPCNDKNFKENLIFYDRDSFDNLIVRFRPSGGQINGLKMWLSVYIGGEYLPVTLPPNYQSEFTFHIIED